MLCNYNHDLELFWDHNKTDFMSKEYEAYTAKKKSLKKLKDSKGLEELDELYRKVIIAKLGKELAEVQQQHRELSEVFGFPVGLSKTLESPVKSILDTTNQILDFIYIFKPLNEEVKMEQVMENRYVEYFVSFLIVRFHITSNS